MNNFISIVFIIALIGNMILDIRVVRSNKERNKRIQQQIDIQHEVMAKLDYNTLAQNARIEELKSHRKKLDIVNRKLTILNKANYKKY